MAVFELVTSSRDSSWFADRHLNGQPTLIVLEAPVSIIETQEEIPGALADIGWADTEGTSIVDLGDEACFRCSRQHTVKT